MNKYCVLIPVFNHHSYISDLVHSLAELNLKSFLIDDGSDLYCREILESITEENESLTLFRLVRNRGKGVAVCKGLRIARAEGYTHAIQIDSDGQYDVGEIKHFIEESEKYPAAVVSGQRKYSDLPGSRRYGRMVTDLWVWINTLSVCIRDSMCGYRLYPLDNTIELIDADKIRERMAFDTDILVKLYWKGLEVKHIPVNVKYGEEIHSHFDLFMDNLQISKMHAAHFFGMIKRMPELLFRKTKRTERIESAKN